MESVRRLEFKQTGLTLSGVSLTRSFKQTDLPLLREFRGTGKFGDHDTYSPQIPSGAKLID